MSQLAPQPDQSPEAFAAVLASKLAPEVLDEFLAKPDPIEFQNDLPVKFQLLFQPHRYKIYYGGRGGAKSWSFAKALIARAYKSKLRILCTREFQNSIADSVHRLISDQIGEMGLDKYFKITQNTITSSAGAQFIFKGLQRSIQEIKSTEGIDICWIEEAQSISEHSWEVLIPTIRAEGSEIWMSFNPNEDTDPTFQRFVLHTPPDSVIQKVNWPDNPHFPKVLDKERLYMLKIDPEAYQHVWEGDCRKISEAIIFKGRFEVSTFDPPSEDMRLFYGADWGFSQDPTALIRSWIRDNILYIDHEAYGVGVELDDLPDMFRTVPGADYRLIKADNARPETISHMKRRGFNIEAAPKWKGCVEDGITVLKGFEKIIIHERCKHMAEEARLYSYKVDKLTQEILTTIEDKHDHCLVAGTMIATSRGDVPIEKVNTKDYVLTRKGYKKVVFSGATDFNRQVVKVVSGDKSIICTPDHKIYSEKKGFTSADALRYNDTLLTLKENVSWLKQQSIRVKSLGDTRTAHAVVIEPILDDLTLIRNRLFFYIDKYGKSILEQFLLDTIPTIKMGIQPIMTLQTLNAFPLPNIPINMNAQRNKESTLIKFGHLQRNGTQALKDWQNTGKLGHLPIKTSFPLRRPVSIAESLSYLRNLAIRIYFALINANPRGEEHRELIMSQGNAPTATKPSPQINIVGLPIVPVCVRNVRPAGKAKIVYDLSIEGEHEFFANGILVHNCWDAVRYA